MVATATILWKKTAFRPCLFAPISRPIHLRTGDLLNTRAALRVINLALRDVARFLDRHYLTAKSADFLHRSLRRRMSQAVLAAAAGFLGARYSAIGGAGPTAALAFVFGLSAWGLQMWATRVLSARLAYARSHGAVLLKDRKKTALMDDLPRLWRRVYAPEIPIVFPDPSVRQALRKRLLNLEQGAVGRTAETRRFDFGHALSHDRSSCALLTARAFRAAVEYELQTAHPQNTQDARLGFSISLLEDALDAAAIGHSENSTFERQAAHAFLAQAKEQLADRHGFFERCLLAVETTIRRQFQTFWRRNVALALEARTGALLRRLHQRYRTTRIDVQDLLWRDEESLFALTLAIADDLGESSAADLPLADTLCLEAEAEARHVFSPDPETVRRIVRRMRGYDLVQATLMLAATDPDYALAYGSGTLPDSPRQGPCDPALDLADAGATGRDQRYLERLNNNAVAAEALWPEACVKACASPQDFDGSLPSPESRRAARLAWHADDGGLRTNVLSGSLFGESLAARLAEIAGDDAQVTERLRALRLCRELAAWELAYTLYYALALCGFDPSGPDSVAVISSTHPPAVRSAGASM